MTSSECAAEVKRIITALLTSNPLNCTVSDLCNDFLRTVGYKIPFRSLGFQNVNAYLRSIPDTLIVHGNGYFAEVEVVIKPNSAHIGEMVSKQKTSKIPPHKRKYLKTECYSSEVIIRPDSGSSMSSDSQTTEAYVGDCNGTVTTENKEEEGKIPPKITQSVLNNLKEDEDFQAKFLEVLQVCSESHGYTSATDMCRDMPQIFNNKPTTPINSHPQKILSIVPPNVLRLGDCIPRLNIDILKVGDKIRVGVGEIYDISKFWIFLESGELQPLMNKLQKYFCNPNNRFLIPGSLLQQELFCVCLYGEEYHRAVIVDILKLSTGFVRVLFIDFGTVENVCTSKVWFLPQSFADVPCQLIRTRLSDVCPRRDNSPWSYASTKRFRELVSSQNPPKLVAEVTKTEKKSNILEIYLADITDEKNIFYINDTLVTEGFATYTNRERKSYPVSPKPNVPQLHLYPKFFEIETGKAPTPTEMEYFFKNNVPLHHFLPQYFETTSSEEICEKAYEKIFSGAVPDLQIDLTKIENGLDFSVFPPDIAKEIRENDGLNESKTIVTNNGGEISDFKEYSCNKKRISELINGAVTSKNGALKDSDREIVAFDSNFENSILSDGDSSVFENSASAKRTSTNPFLDDDLNPFRPTNPFSSHTFEETVNTSDLSNLFSQDQETNLNDLDSHLGQSKSCAKQADGEELSASTNPFLSCRESASPKSTNPFLNFETNRAEPARVRTPPGFTSESREPVYNPYYNQMCFQNYYANYPYYQGPVMRYPNFGIPALPFCPTFVPQFQFNLNYLQRALAAQCWQEQRNRALNYSNHPSLKNKK